MFKSKRVIFEACQSLIVTDDLARIYEKSRVLWGIKFPILNVIISSILNDGN